MKLQQCYFLMTYLVSSASSVASETEELTLNQQATYLLDEERKKREASTRPKRCPSLSCHEMLSTHTFGKPSRLCQGRTTAELPESTIVPTAQPERRRKNKLLMLLLLWHPLHRLSWLPHQQLQPIYLN